MTLSQRKSYSSDKSICLTFHDVVDSMKLSWACLWSRLFRNSHWTHSFHPLNAFHTFTHHTNTADHLAKASTKRLHITHWYTFRHTSDSHPWLHTQSKHKIKKETTKTNNHSQFIECNAMHVVICVCVLNRVMLLRNTNNNLRRTKKKKIWIVGQNNNMRSWAAASIREKKPSHSSNWTNTKLVYLIIFFIFLLFIFALSFSLSLSLPSNVTFH